MDEVTVCPTCHVNVRITDYYCFNCGKNLHEKPPSLSIITMVSIVIGSLLLPPMGIIWGVRYLKQSDVKSRLVGLVAILITIIELIWLTFITIGLINQINSQVNSQIQNIQGF
jgi:hypothetical protein